MTSHVIKIVGRPGGVVNQDPRAGLGEWVKSYDPDAFDGRGDVETTFDVSEALRFPSGGDAFAFWRTQSSVRPLRADGLPNRPLTAFSIEIHEYRPTAPDRRYEPGETPWKW